MNRRRFLQASVALAGLAAAGPLGVRLAQATERKDTMAPANWQLSKEEWRARLTDEQYRVLREEGTERAFTSPFNHEKRPGVFHCAGCDLALFDNAHKFDSGTGWPSFYQPITEGSVGTRTDYKLVWPRTEVHCSRCHGHLGHVFKDGPPPTGLRYCMNGVAMTFKAA